MEKAKPNVPPEENGCLKLLALSKRVPAKYSTERPAFDLLPNVQLSREQLAAIDGHAATMPLTLTDLQALHGLPRGEWPAMTFEDSLGTDYPRPARLLSVWLHDLLLLDCQRGRLTEAFAAINAQLDVTRLGTCDVLLLPFLIRCAQDRVLVQSIERILGQFVNCAPDKLAATRQRLQDELELLRLAPAIRRERAWIFRLWEIVADGPQEEGRKLAGISAAAGIADPADSALRWQIRGWLWHSQAVSLELMTKAVEVAGQPIDGQAKGFAGLDHEVKLVHSGQGTVVGHYWNQLGTLALPSILKIAEGYLRTQALMRCAHIALAVEEFRLKHGRWPESLAEVERTMKLSIPRDPFDGGPLKYVRREDGVTIYSVGRDLKDNGGRIPAKPDEWRDVDDGVRLWDPKHRRLPSPPEEPLQKP